MSDILDFKRPTSSPVGPAKPPKSKLADDYYLLKWCTEWRAARAQQQKNWAEHELATMWDTVPNDNIELDTEPLGKMKDLQEILATDVGRPHTLLGARELLGVVVTILAHEDPGSTMAKGPLLEIVRNVVSALEFQKAEMRIGPKRGQCQG